MGLWRKGRYWKAFETVFCILFCFCWLQEFCGYCFSQFLKNPESVPPLRSLYLHCCMEVFSSRYQTVINLIHNYSVAMKLRMSHFVTYFSFQMGFQCDFLTFNYPVSFLLRRAEICSSGLHFPVPWVLEIYEQMWIAASCEEWAQHLPDSECWERME